MKVEETYLKGVFVVETSPLIDTRGSFERFFCDRELDPYLVGEQPINQINYSVNTQKGTIRGIHYQTAPHAETKMVRCVKGRVWDVAVDLRYRSPTFLKWYAIELSPSSHNMVIIPKGVAHGYQTIEEDSHLLYLHTAHYNSDAQAGLAWNDPELKITWPLPSEALSDRDKRHRFISEDFIGVEL
ncbi:dtdp-4-dehydrorhamnose 3,5-epimerase [Oleiphilus messinensis]|uniref:dTDP-4-dehydrorhamnose 3,5-epimerase n=1 Tax=Oleiphilus messinensis TaxID=141451 RepID=A0A1Y0I708_9GAMM|nr:dTDP-4-dehydrorhamnose 3,5-epimerase family protein [Oleiphilus messinensis]ARU56010.1 dtdp-4-dehydrorhamnose 3,5-epimerase [Oleiphilus messinensis]